MPLPSVLLAFAVSVGIGLLGISRANRAVRLCLIDALRYESSVLASTDEVLRLVRS
ncbi:MAG: hypothetical protein ACRDYA_06505 [Egibacteraceae bacterium]